MNGLHEQPKSKRTPNSTRLRLEVLMEEDLLDDAGPGSTAGRGTGAGALKLMDAMISTEGERGRRGEVGVGAITSTSTDG